MTPRTITGTLLLLLLATIANAQQPAIVGDQNRMLTYRTVDSDTGEELFRTKIWQGQAVDDAHPAFWSDSIFADGDRQVAECVQGNGIGKPATMRRAILVNSAGELGLSDFETID